PAPDQGTTGAGAADDPPDAHQQKRSAALADPDTGTGRLAARVCGRSEVAGGAVCGWSEVAGGAVCGWSEVADGAVCGWSEVADGASLRAVRGRSRSEVVSGPSRAAVGWVASGWAQWRERRTASRQRWWADSSRRPGSKRWSSCQVAASSSV